MDFPEIFTLKQLLLDANATIDDLKGVRKYFFKNLGTKQAFLKAGAGTTNKDIDGMLEAFAQKLFGKDIDMAGTPVVVLSDYHFIHGPFAMEAKDGTVIYFTDVGKGMIMMAWDAKTWKYMPFTVGGPFTG